MSSTLVQSAMGEQQAGTSVHINFLDPNVPFEAGGLRMPRPPVLTRVEVAFTVDGKLTEATQAVIQDSVQLSLNNRHTPGPGGAQVEAEVGNRAELEPEITNGNNNPDSSERSFGKLAIAVAAGSVASLVGGIAEVPATAQANQIPAPPAKSAQPFEIDSPFAAANTAGAQISDSQQDCVDASLDTGQVLQHVMTHPGKKTGRYQTVRFAEKYPQINPEFSDECLRILKGSVEIRVNGAWHNMQPGWKWAWVASTNEGYTGSARLTPTGHEPNWWFWKPGDKVRGILENVVQDPSTHQVLATRDKVVPITVRRPHSKHS